MATTLTENNEAQQAIPRGGVLLELRPELLTYDDSLDDLTYSAESMAVTFWAVLKPRRKVAWLTEGF